MDFETETSNIVGDKKQRHI